jgi:YegS/Rv2252/BmrU family lipid kinase
MNVLPLVIANPNSANGKTGRDWSSIRSKLEAAIGAVDVTFTSAQSDATRLAREAAQTGRQWIIAVGGDGTINEVVNGLVANDKPVNPQTALSFIMRGTGNDFRRSLTEARDLESDIACLATERRRRIDVGKVSFVDHAGAPTVRYFDNIASFGMSGEVDRRVNTARFTKRFGGTIAFAWATLATLATYHNRPVAVKLDGESMRFESLRLGVVANGKFAGGGMQFAPDARLDDGLFDVLFFEGISSFDVIHQMPNLYTGKHIGRRGIVHRRCRKLEVSSDFPLLLDVDGEAPGRLPATFEVVPEVLTVRC